MPFLLGFLFFFLQPFILSFVYSVNSVSISGGSVVYKPQGFSYYREALTINTGFRDAFISGIQNLITMVPMILIFSLFIAVLLNKNFFGRNMSRIVLFLPVIITTGVLLSVESTDYLVNQGVNATASSASVYTKGEFRIESLLTGLQLPSQLMAYLAAVIDKFYSILISAGVQITVFLAALQSISPALYEASAIEGATAWDDFWKITLPMVSPYIYVCALYSIVDTFGNATNGIVGYIHKVAFEVELNYGLASAMSWLYFLAAAIIIGLVSLLFARLRASENKA